MLDAVGLTPQAVELYAYGTYLLSPAVRRRNRAFRRSSPPDGLPWPSPRMVFLVTGQFELQNFYESGTLGARTIRETLARHGYDLGRFRALLDFGCGCGRVLRHWKDLPVDVHGCDFNPYLLDWCRAHLRFARFTRNEPAARLAHADASFDFVYAISVFTHLAEREQRFWIEELTRVLRPGGLLLITVHGDSYVAGLTPQAQAEFRDGRLVVIRERHAGTNVCAAYHPESYVRGVLSRGLRVVDFVPVGARDARQDLYLLQKTDGGAAPA